MPDPTPIRVLIADDEVLARQRLEDLLALEPGVEIVGQAANGLDAAEAIRRLRPDLVFLDIQMPGLTGTEVVREIGPEHMPLTMFVTAYDQYALKAFELAAVDYLLKPFEDERFEQAFERARKQLAVKEVGALTDRLMALLQGLAPGAPPPPRARAAQPYLERIAVESRGQVRVVPVGAIDFVTADGPYAELHVGQEKFIIRERMQNLEERLNPEHFFRVHRSTIVRLEQVDALLNRGGGDYALRLKDGRKLSVSRTRYDELEARLGLR